MYFWKIQTGLCFFKVDDTWLKVGVISQPDLVNINVYGATIEFKVDLLPQVLADLERVASNLLIDSLKHGKVVDAITIYGLLVLYNNEKAIPLKYFADFNENTYKLCVREKEYFHKIFSYIVLLDFINIYCILHKRIKGFDHSIATIMCEDGRYRTVVG